MADLVEIASNEIGYSEQGSNSTKYGAWFGMNGAAWCHMFVSWCANQAGILNSYVPNTAACATGKSWYVDKKRFGTKGQYTPKRNDIIYFLSNGASHVGIVESSNGSTVNTIEGNTSNKVGRRSYSLDEARITGYGIVSSYVNPNSTENPSGNRVQPNSNNKNSKTELEYLKSILSRRKESSDKITAKKQTNTSLASIEISLIINNGTNLFLVPVIEELKLSMERVGTPGKLTFETIIDSQIQVKLGNAVSLEVDGKKVFYGFVFNIDQSKDGRLDVTAYDQLRYLKNKDTLIYTEKTTSELISQIARNFNLKIGHLEETAYKMSKIEDDTTLFDMIQNSLDETLMTKNELFVLYDDYGKITLKNIKNMKVNSCLIDEETAENYKYKKSIDDKVYNQVKLLYDNSETGTQEVYITKNSDKINEWGLLQYLEKIDNPEIGEIKSNVMLEVYCKPQRTISIDGAFGNTDVIAGAMIPVLLTVGEYKIHHYLLVEKVTHKFKNKQHSMDLILSGGDFNV